jgi:hypothetical protein
VSAYVPRISRATLVHPLFACDVSQIPRAYIPCRLTDFDGDVLDPNELSLMSAEDLPFCTVPGSREVLFGCCRFYNPTAYVSQAHTSHLAAARAATQNVAHQMGIVSPGQIQMTIPSMPAANMAGMMPVQMAGAPGGMPMAVPQMAGRGMMQVPQAAPRGMMPVQAAPAPVPVQAAAAPLPDGWEQKASPDGRQYFVNHNTKETQWTRPVAPVAQAAAPVPVAAQPRPMMQRGSSVRGNTLPPGWEAKVAPDGRKYYVDHNTGSTSWTPPGMGGV